MNNIIIYNRVSTDDQADKGYSIQYQEITCKQYSKVKKYNVVATLNEDYSAKTFERPEWKKIMSLIKQKKNFINKIVFLKWDRFSRNQYEAIRTIKALEKLNVEVECVEQPLDLSIPDNLLLLNIYLTVPEIENKKNSDRTIAAMRQAALLGCWVGKPLFGYVRDWAIKDTETTKQKNATLKPKEPDASIVRRIFTSFVFDNLSAESIRLLVWNEYGKKFSKQNILDILRNVGYLGLVKVKPNKQEGEKIVVGLHPAIIEKDLFQSAKDVLEGKKRSHIRKDNNEEFPLKEIIKCSTHGCGYAFTASVTTKNKGTKKYSYYHCSKTKGHDRFPAQLVHKTFLELLAELQVNEEIKNAYRAVLINTIKKHNSEISAKRLKIEEQIKILDSRIINTENSIADGKNTDVLINSLNRYNKERDEAIMRHATLKAEEAPKESDVVYLMSLFNSFENMYSASDFTIKKKLVGSMFPNSLYFHKNHFRTESVSPLFELLFLKMNKLEKLIIETSRLKSGSSSSAPPLRLERRTPSLTVMCSNQLS